MEVIYKMWLHHTHMPEMVKLKLLNYKNKNYKNIYDMTYREFDKIGVRYEYIKKMEESKKNMIKYSEIVEYTRQNSIDIIDITQTEYPKLLKEIPDPPIILYGKGNKKSLLEEIKFAIVGTRQHSDYGEQMARQFSAELSQRGFCITSGMALGIDAIAHESALRQNNNTIAVLGTGVDICYPIVNNNLYNKILEHGYMISEYAPRTMAKTYHFPKRNRIVSGMSVGVLIVEAGLKSGSLITANIALEQNREVFSIPADVDKIRGRGTNEIIKVSAAKLVENIEDIMNDIPDHVTKKLISSKEQHSLDKVQSIVYNGLSWQPISYAQLEYKTKIDTQSLDVALMRLEMQQYIKKVLGNKYVKLK
ncbi:MAG: DNA protecting protein DprA [Epulopiscium sp. Nuni2H_MBin003]|nr:MAG: DNA protecting protein DprA [Epulopiscium sp. Nuni2H_MBin003]